MRLKDSGDQERKNVSRNLEKQTKLIERLTESEKVLMAQLVSFLFRVIK